MEVIKVNDNSCVKDYAKKLISQDCIDLYDAISSNLPENNSYFMLAAMPYICLVTNEACEWCKKAKKSIKPFKSKTILEKIRAKSKLFSNDRGVTFLEQQLALKNLVEIEHFYFKSLAKPYCPDCFITDVGTYSINNIFIGNTIQYAFDFQSFYKPNKSVYQSGEEIKLFTEEIGYKLQEIITNLTGEHYSISNSVHLHYDVKEKDFIYKKKFNKINNIISFSISCRINFLLIWFKQNCRTGSMLYLRLLYITFFSLKDDLDNLGISYENIFDNHYNIKFRNSMAHYSLYNKINDSEILPKVIGFGIIEKYFNIDYIEIVDIIEVKLYKISALLDEYFKIKC